MTIVEGACRMSENFDKLKAKLAESGTLTDDEINAAGLTDEEKIWLNAERMTSNATSKWLSHWTNTLLPIKSSIRRQKAARNSTMRKRSLMPTRSRRKLWRWRCFGCTCQ